MSNKEASSVNSELLAKFADAVWHKIDWLTGIYYFLNVTYYIL
ncbi:hypothetical protein UT300005_31310 [Clostridium sp. CTA-5]